MAHLPDTPDCRLKFWGVRGSIPTPGASTVLIGGNTSCVEVRTSKEIIILDAGTGIRALGRALSEEFQGQPLCLTILISHTHWDHIQGLPFFAPAYQKENLLRIIGPEDPMHRLASSLEGQMHRPYFPIAMHQLPGNLIIEELKGRHFDIGTVQVQTIQANHPGTTLGYRLFTSAGSIAYLPDHESFQHLHHPEKSQESQETAFLEFVRGADILILDSQYDRSEYPEHKGWGHGCLEEVVQLAIKAGVHQLILFHHDPDHDDSRIAFFVITARQIASSCGSSISIEAAREGLEIDLRNRELK